METKQIKPKTLIAVLAAHIKDSAEEIAQSIVETVKNNNVEYDSLVEEYVLDINKSRKLCFASFSNSAFEAIKDYEKIRSFTVSLFSKWELDQEKKEWKNGENNLFTIEAELDKKHPKYGFYESARVTGNSIYPLFDMFKVSYSNRLLEINNVPKTEVIIE